MNTGEMIQKIKNEEVEQDTIIPEFQESDTCVFCDDKAHDDMVFGLLRVYYNKKNGTKYWKLDKETCIHHKDKWLIHSYRTAGFIWSAYKKHFKESITNGEVAELFKNKEEREKILTEYYDKGKKFSCAAHLYLDAPLEVKEKRYSNAFTIEDDIPVQNKIIQNKFKIAYTNAIEVLQAYGNEVNEMVKKGEIDHSEVIEYDWKPGRED